jgi:hypothetical protein
MEHLYQFNIYPVNQRFYLWQTLNHNFFKSAHSFKCSIIDLSILFVIVIAFY